jgi:hypothetical protein
MEATVIALHKDAPQSDFMSFETSSKVTVKTVTRKGIQNQRISFTTVRTILGNEITDYHLDYREGENLSEIDFADWTPLHKYFGRFSGEDFTGIKYNYGYALGQEKIGKYVESIIEYCNGSVTGEQIYFNTEGDVIRKMYIQADAYVNIRAMQSA